MSNTSNLVDTSNVEAGNANAVIQGIAEDNDPNKDIPEKFRGKDLREVVKSYQELESLQGKQAQELGELRRLTDAYIRSQLEKDTVDTTPRRDDMDLHVPVGDPDDDVDLDPTVAKAVQKKLAPVERELVELRKEKFTAKLTQKHSDFEGIVSDKSFQDWVMESPVRVELFKRADRNFDINAAVELFDTWKEKKKVPELVQDAANAEKERSTAFKQAHMETGTVTETAPKKTYRRADIIDLKMRDPNRYRSLLPEIEAAYREGRVK